MKRFFHLFCLSILLILLNGCGDVFEAQNQQATFKTYNSLYADAMDQSDEGISPNDLSNQVERDGATSQVNTDGGDGNDPNHALATNGGGTMGGGGMIPVTGHTSVDTPEPTGQGNGSNGNSSTSTGNNNHVVTMPGGGHGSHLNPGNSANRPRGENLEAKFNVQKMCQPGEVDLVRATMVCHKDLNLIATKKDAMGEALLKDYGNAGQVGDVEDIIKKLKKENLDGMVYGSSLELFVCLDSNKNGSCMDEEIRDINSFNGMLLRVLGELQHQQVARDQRVRNIANIFACDSKAMKSIRHGLVVFHQKFSDPNMDMKASDFTEFRVAGVLDALMRNIKAEAETDQTDFGTMIGVNLIESDIHKCPQVNIRTNGCFVSGTEIQLDKEFSTKVENLKVGDSVYLSNGQTSKIQKIVSGPELKPVINLELISGQMVTVTDTHPMLTEMGVIQAKDLTIGSRLLTSDGHWSTLKTISAQKYQGKVYNFELAGANERDHLIYGNGIVTGDLYLQQKLQEKSSPGVIFSLLSY